MDDPKKAPELPDDHDPDRVPGHPEPEPAPAAPPAEEPDAPAA